MKTMRLMTLAPTTLLLAFCSGPIFPVDKVGQPVVEEDGTPVVITEPIEKVVYVTEKAKETIDTVAPLLPPPIGWIAGLVGSIGVAVAKTVQASQRKREIEEVVRSVEIAKEPLISLNPVEYREFMKRLQASQTPKLRTKIKKITES